jgi:hypothetical protein
MNMNGGHGAIGQPLEGLSNGNNIISGPNRGNGAFYNSNVRTLRSWTPPPNGVVEWEGTDKEMTTLYKTLPKELSEHLMRMFPPDVLNNLNEIYLQLGQVPECIVSNMNEGGRKERSTCG